MEVIMDGHEIPVTRSNLIIARDSVNSFVDVVKLGSEKNNNEALYLTTLIMMYKKSTELLAELGVDNIKYIMEDYYNKVAALKDE